MSGIDDDGETTGPEEISEGSQLPLCMIHRVLTGQKKEEPAEED